MQAKGFIALLVATVIVVIVAMALTIGGGGPVGDARNGESVFASLKDRIGDVATLKITGAAGDAATLQRHGTGDKEDWGVAEKGGYPADPAKIRQVLLGFAELKLVEPKTRKADFYTRLDVEDPGTDRGTDTSHSRLVEIDDSKGAKLGELIVGKRRPDDLGTGADGLYIRHPGDPQAWLAQGSVDLPADAKDWLDKKIVGIPPARIREVTLTHADGTTLILKRDKEDAKFAIDGAPADTKLKSDSAVAEPAGVLDGLELSDVRPAADMPTPTDGVFRAQWVTFDGLTVTGETFDKDGSSWVRFSATGSGDKAAEAEQLNAKFTPWTFAVYPYKANAMKTNLADLVEPPKAS
jgi:hypothetical protein